MTRLAEKDSSGLAEVLRQSWPASLAMLNNQVIRFVDGLMVSHVGPTAMSAQLVAGMWAFVAESFPVGVLTVVNTYVSQNFGAGRFRSTARYAWAGVAITLALSAAMAPLALLARPIFALFAQPGQEGAEALLSMEVMYFRYMILSMALTISSRPLEQFFFGVHRPRIVLVTSLVANAVNVLGNYVLIFGKMGFPALGLKGAAIGSIAAWALQLAMLLAVFLSPAMHRTFATRFVRTVRLRHCRELLRLGWPAGLQLCNDILCWSMFLSVLVSRMFGGVHLAASVIAMRYMGLSFMPAVGLGIATTAIVGKTIGEGKPEVARRRAHSALVAAMVYMGLCGLAFWLFRGPMVAFFVNVQPSVTLQAQQAQQMAEQIIDVGAKIMICAAVFQLFDAVGIIFIGALRGAGDTFWPMVATIALSWGMVVGGGYVVASIAPQWTSIGPWVAGSLYVVALGVVMAWRFESGAWRKIDLLARRVTRLPAAAETIPAEPGTVCPPLPGSDPPDKEGNRQ